MFRNVCPDELPGPDVIQGLVFYRSEARPGMGAYLLFPQEKPLPVLAKIRDIWYNKLNFAVLMCPRNRHKRYHQDIDWEK